MLTPIPPWESVNPFDFINAASQGARIGLERAGLETGAQDAAQKLKLGYAQLASQNARAKEAAGRASAADALENARLQFGIQQAGIKNAQDALEGERLNQYRQGELGIRNQMAENAAKSANAKRYVHVGNQIVDITGNTPVSVFQGPAQIDPYDRMKYQAANQRVQNARRALNGMGPNDKARPALQKEFEDAKAELDAMDARRSKGSAADALNNFDNVPSAFPGAGPGFIPSGTPADAAQNPDDPLGILQAAPAPNQ